MNTEPTYRLVLILNWSNDPVGYKKAAFQSFYKRALIYCSTEEGLNKELEYILEVGKQHGYRKVFLTKIFKQVKKKMCERGEGAMEPRDKELNYILMPYHLRNLKVMKRIAKRKCVRLAPRRNLTLFDILRNEKDPFQQKEPKGVYRIPVKDMQTNEESEYIGVTGRTIARRLEEQKKDIEQARLTMSLAVEAYSKNITVKWEEAKIVKRVQKQRSQW